MKIVTHVNVDLDAVACAWACGATEIILIPAGAKEIPPEHKDALVLDHPLGLKGDKNTCALWAYRNQLPQDYMAKIANSLVEEVQEQDTIGMVKHPRFSLAHILAALRREGMDDQEIISHFRPILEGINLLDQDKKTAVGIINNARTITTTTGHKFLVLAQEVGPMVGVVANEMEYAGAIYQNGFSLGVTRYPGHDSPDLKKLRKQLPGKEWFCHEAGFLFCYGSRKSPATKLAPITLETLIKAVESL
ncbi:MAG TPA: hypothetical protein VI728_07680 [Syntrophales bacterium]|nr:hypothetical protein [Syntrophales bacterium]